MYEKKVGKVAAHDQRILGLSPAWDGNYTFSVDMES